MSNAVMKYIDDTGVYYNATGKDASVMTDEELLKNLEKVENIVHTIQTDASEYEGDKIITSFDIVAYDENLVEYLVKFIVEEKIKPNVQNQNTHVEPTQSPTFVCAQCKKVFPMKYMHKQGICVNCISEPHKYHITKQPSKEQNIKNREAMLGAKESHECSKEIKSIFMQKYISCSCCGAKVPQATVQKFYGQEICQNCYEGFQKIAEAIEANIDPYTLPLTSEQKEERHIVAQGVFVDDVTYVTYKMQKQLFRERYEKELNRTISRGYANNSVYLFNCDEETSIYFDKKYEIPYEQFWRNSRFAFHPSTCSDPSNKYPISFYEVELLAKATSDTLYEKYKGINEFNWKEYIK